MKIPWVPLTVAATLVILVVFLFNSMDSGPKVFGQPRLERLADLDGIETEVSIAPDGNRLVAVVSGDLWLFDIAQGSRQRLTQTIDKESFPAWAPDGQQVSFTRGANTFTLPAAASDNQEPELFKENATSLSWSATGRLAFVRDRTLWITDMDGTGERALLEPDANPELSVRGPRFSPDSQQIAFIKTNLGLRGEVWTIDANKGAARALVSDRPAENPLDVAWIEEGKQLVYLTNRSGAYGFWVINFEANTISPLTGGLNGMPLERVGISAWKDRIFIPRHQLDSDIVVSDGTSVARTPDNEFEPAASHDGTLVAYTIQKENKFEIWTAGIHGEDARFRVLGTQPRFSANGFEVIYTHTDILGQVDLRKVDIRDGSSSSVTDAVDIDFEPDWSPDGRTIAFASNQGGTMMLWTMPTVGGQRRSLNVGGYFPKFSLDGQSLSYWSQESIWTVGLHGANPRRVGTVGVPQPTPSAWVNGSPKTYLDPAVHAGKTIWPGFDVLPDGRMLTAPINIHETALWTVNLTYVDKND
jgi:Tol biopolymer transport system component